MLHMHVQLHTFQTKYFFFILRLPYNIKTLFHERYPPYFELNVMLSIVKNIYKLRSLRMSIVYDLESFYE